MLYTVLPVASWLFIITMSKHKIYVEKQNDQSRRKESTSICFLGSLKESWRQVGVQGEWMCVCQQLLRHYV